MILRRFAETDVKSALLARKVSSKLYMYPYPFPIHR